MDGTTMRRRVTSAPVGRLGTITAGGRPHLVPCCYCLDADTAYSAVDHKPKTTGALRRIDNLLVHPEASLLVDRYDDDWSALWWVRLDCRGYLVTEPDEEAAALDGLVAKYPQYRQRRPRGPVIGLEILRWRGWP